MHNLFESRIELPTTDPRLTADRLARLRSRIARADEILGERVQVLRVLPERLVASWRLSRSSDASVELDLHSDSAHVVRPVTDGTLDSDNDVRDAIRQQLWDYLTAVAESNHRGLVRLGQELEEELKSQLAVSGS